MTTKNRQDLEARHGSALSPRKKTKPVQLTLPAPAALLDEIEGFDDVLSEFRRSFRLMAVAEEVLLERWPGKNEPRAAFMLLMPTRPVRIGAKLFRAHARELVERFALFGPDSGSWKPAEWNDLVLLTRAEVLGLLAEASARHPLGHDDTLMYETILRRTFSPEELGASLRDLEHHTYGPTRLAEVERGIADWLARTSPERADTVAKLRGKP